VGGKKKRGARRAPTTGRREKSGKEELKGVRSPKKKSRGVERSPVRESGER